VVRPRGQTRQTVLKYANQKCTRVSLRAFTAVQGLPTSKARKAAGIANSQAFRFSQSLLIIPVMSFEGMDEKDYCKERKQVRQIIARPFSSYARCRMRAELVLPDESRSSNAGKYGSGPGISTFSVDSLCKVEVLSVFFHGLLGTTQDFIVGLATLTTTYNGGEPQPKFEN
jgi:hypothetical protein